MYYLLQTLLAKFPITIFFDIDLDYFKNKLNESLCNYLQKTKTKTLPFIYHCPSDLIAEDLNQKLMYSMIVNCLLLVFFIFSSVIKYMESRSIKSSHRNLDEMLTKINETKKLQTNCKRQTETEEKLNTKKQKVTEPLNLKLDINDKILETFNLESFIDSKSDIENINLIKKWNDNLEKEIKQDNEVNEKTSFVEIDLHSEEEYEKVN